MAANTTEPAAKAPVKPKRGFLRFIPIILALVITPVGAWYGLEFFNRSKMTEAEKAKAAGEKSKAASEKEKKTKPGVGRVAVPLTPNFMVFVPRNPSDPLSVDQIQTTNAVPTIPYDRITVVLADKNRTRYAQTAISLIGTSTEELIAVMNSKSERKLPDAKLTPTKAQELFAAVSELLSQKVARDVSSPEFRNIFRHEVLLLCEQSLGPGIVREVVLTEGPVIQ